MWRLVLLAAAQGLQLECPTTDDILANLTAEYDVLSHPGKRSKQPTHVGLQLMVASIVKVEQKQQQLALEGYFRSEWVDPRLAQAGPCNETVVITLPQPQGQPAIWQPDIFFDNSVSEWYGFGSLTIYPDGRVFRSRRFHHTFSCRMNFEALPFDGHDCMVAMSSYSWDVENVNATAFSNGAVDIDPEYDGTNEFRLTTVSDDVQTTWFGTGLNRKGYAYIYVYMHLDRRPTAYMMFVFGTCMLFALVAWSGLFINRAIAPARVTIAVIPVLIMLNLETNVTSTLPPLNYLTWLTSYLLLMKLFSISVVFEYALVAFLMQLEAARERQFEACKHIAAALKKKRVDEEACIAQEIVQLAERSPQITVTRKEPRAAWSNPGTRGRDAQARDPAAHATGDDFLNISAHGREASKLSRLDPARNFAKLEKHFDLDKSGDLGWKEVQRGFRRLGQYWSKDQVQELFYRLGIQGQTLPSADFQKLMMDIDQFMPGKAMSITFSEHPPSLQVDLVFRYAYITGVIGTTVTWTVLAFL
ncbi:unnamed protein product [Effrenium voratum]|nr:unnamed protein product [Effrenium voratum]